MVVRIVVSSVILKLIKTKILQNFMEEERWFTKFDFLINLISLLSIYYFTIKYGLITFLYAIIVFILFQALFYLSYKLGRLSEKAKIK